MNTNYPGWNATKQAICPECGAFVNESKRHQACKQCGTAVFIMNGEVVQREPRPGTEV